MSEVDKSKFGATSAWKERGISLRFVSALLAIVSVVDAIDRLLLNAALLQEAQMVESEVAQDRIQGAGQATIELPPTTSRGRRLTDYPIPSRTYSHSGVRVQ